MARQRKWTVGRVVLWVGLPVFLLVYVGGGVVYAVKRSSRDDDADRSPAAASVPEVVVDTPPDPARPFTLPDPPPGDLATDGNTWPRACTLLADNDLKLTLPQATGFTREGSGTTLTFGTRKIAVPEQTCSIDFHLPHKESAGPAPHEGHLTVRVEAFGDPAVVDDFDGEYLSRGDADETFARQHVAWRCAGHAPKTHPSGLVCTKGPLKLSVQARLDTLETAVEPAVMGYLLDKILA